eukprot:tig00020824_g14235.t1
MPPATPERGGVAVAPEEGSEGQINTLWKEVLADRPDQPHESRWYGDAKDYWSKVDATVDGVLGGYGKVDGIDIRGSAAFLEALMGERLKQGDRLHAVGARRPAI